MTLFGPPCIDVHWTVAFTATVHGMAAEVLRPGSLLMSLGGLFVEGLQ